MSISLEFSPNLASNNWCAVFSSSSKGASQKPHLFVSVPEECVSGKRGPSGARSQFFLINSIALT